MQGVHVFITLKLLTNYFFIKYSYGLRSEKIDMIN
jgi:hypothetical protein